MTREDELLSSASISVSNAGLVILNSYFSILFARLKITENDEFISNKAQYDAVHYLQFVATGLQETVEHILPLNKVLCGLNLSEPIEVGIAMTIEQKDLIEGMINASIEHWSAIGSSSISGFRGNWLVRDGILTEREESWELKVEKRAYDILLNQFPFSFSIIKLPWMAKPLHVSWPY